MKGGIEWRIVDPMGIRTSFIGRTSGEAWAAIEVAWGDHRADLVEKGYLAMPFRVTLAADQIRAANADVVRLKEQR